MLDSNGILVFADIVRVQELSLKRIMRKKTWNGLIPVFPDQLQCPLEAA